MENFKTFKEIVREINSIDAFILNLLLQTLFFIIAQSFIKMI